MQLVPSLSLCPRARQWSPACLWLPCSFTTLLTYMYHIWGNNIPDYSVCKHGQFLNTWGEKCSRGNLGPWSSIHVVLNLFSPWTPRKRMIFPFQYYLIYILFHKGQKLVRRVKNTINWCLKYIISYCVNQPITPKLSFDPWAENHLSIQMTSSDRRLVEI